MFIQYIDGLAQNYGNSSMLAMELPQSCAMAKSNVSNGVNAILHHANDPLC